MQSTLITGQSAIREAGWTITPVTLGRRWAQSSWFNYLEGGSEPLEIAYRVWLLRNADTVILVDTGPPMGEASKRGITEMAPVDQRLRELSIEPADIEHVVLTHLHWDHASSADLFPNARFYVQQSELDFFAGDAWENDATARFFSHRAMLEGLIRNGQFMPLDGDALLCAGIELMKVGGHTPGSQIVAVQTADGVCVLTGDAVPMNRNYTDAIPTGILVDLMQVVNARKRIRALRPHSLFTGHDPIERLICE